MVCQLLNVAAGAMRGGAGSAGSDHGKAGSDASFLGQVVARFLRAGIQALPEVPPAGAHTNALCDLAQQAAQLVCDRAEAGRGRAGVRGVLEELLGAVQMLKGMRRNALVRRIQALQCSAVGAGHG